MARSNGSRHGAWADLENSGPPPAAQYDVPVRVTHAGPVRVVEVDLDQVPRARRRELMAGATRVDAPAPFAAAAGLVSVEEPPTGAGHRKRRGQDPAPAVAEPGVMELPAPRGYVVRQSSRRARRGWYAPSAPAALTSTHQAEILNTALVAAPTTSAGIFQGRDRLSNTPVAHDPFTAYEARPRQITSPASVLLGLVGVGKSSVIKTVYILRPLILRGRRVVVMDRKDRDGEGEYCELARQFGSEPLRMVIGGGGTRLNIFDPAILAGAGVAGQARLLIALAELANDGETLDKWEKASLRAAHTATLRQGEADGVVPILEHLLFHLGRTTHPEYSDYSPAALERIHQGGLGVRHLLGSLLSDELSGLFDGPTSPSVRLADRLTVFDISQLPDDGPSAAMVMSVANVWLLGTLRNQRGLRTNFIAEEGWDLVGGPGGRVFQRNSKLARGLGLSNIAALHHVADIPADDPAIAMLKEAQTIHLFRQGTTEDIEAVVKMYGLDPGARSTLADLPTGHHLLKIGSRREIHVEHIRSRLERRLTDTDAAMVPSAGRAL